MKRVCLTFSSRSMNEKGNLRKINTMISYMNVFVSSFVLNSDEIKDENKQYYENIYQS
jgi:hypothetical protein